jgi:hypothetical protein
MSIKLEFPKDPIIMASVARWLLEQAKAVQTPEGETLQEIVDKQQEQPAADASLADAEKVFKETDNPAVVDNTPPPPDGSDETPTPPAADAVDTDHFGHPWDARIHSSGRTINKKDKHWNYKRGADKALIAKVEADAQKIANASNGTPPPPAGDNTPPPPAGDAPAVDEITFITIAEQVGRLGAAGKMGPDTLITVVKPYGAAEFADISQDKYKPFYATIAAELDRLIAV